MEATQLLHDRRILVAYLLIIGTLVFPYQSFSAVTLIVPNDRGLQDTDGNFVYLRRGIGAEFCSPPGTVLRASVTGGMVDTLYASCDFSPFYVRVGGPNLFVLDWDADDVVKLPITGGSPLKIADTQRAVFHRGFDTDEDFVFWADGDGVKRAFKTGIGTTTLATIDAFGVGLVGLAVDETYVYYIETNFSGSPFTYTVKRVLKSGGSAQTLYLSPGSSFWSVGGIHVDSDNLYWLEAISNDPNVMKKMPKDGSASPVTFINPGSSRTINTLELRSNLVFFTESQHPLSVEETSGKLRYIDKTGGAITDLVTGLTNPFALVTDNRFVYWSDDNGRVGGTSGTKREDLPPFDNDGDGFDQTVDCDDNDPQVTEGNTCVSDSPVTVESDSGEVTVTFPEVTGGGTTMITVEECTPSDVEGITLAPTTPLCADIETDAAFEGQAKVCISYDDTGLSLPQEANLTMIRCEDAGSCEALACEPPEPVDTVNNIVCGCTDGFSTFAVGTLIDTDSDFTPDLLDNCPEIPNIFQQDADEDGIGDACECGDFDGNGFVNTLDARLIQRHVVGEIAASALCDTTGDRNCNTSDARLIQLLAVGRLQKEDLTCAARP